LSSSTRQEELLTAAFNALENLDFAFTVLNGEYDPCDIASESAPVTAEAIAATVDFVNHSEIEVSEIAGFHARIAKWPGMLAHVRAEQTHQKKETHDAR
jgi:hypothetical protein